MSQRAMTMTKRGLLLWIGAAWAVPAMATPEAAEPLAALSETVDVRVANIETVVTANGSPVLGLGADDFRLLVDGEERPIEFFTEVRGGVAIDAGARRQVAGIPSLVSGEPVGVSYLVFVDDYFSLAQDRDRVLEALRAQLGGLRPEDRMAIVAYDGSRLEMLSSWTGSRPELERAIRRAEARPARGLQRWLEQRSGLLPSRSSGGRRQGRILPASLRGDLTPDEYFYGRQLEDQVGREVQAAAAMLRGFGAVPGRRVALLLSGGWPYDIPAYVAEELARPIREPGFLAATELYRPLVETANLLGYSLYPVDLPGLQESALADADGANGDVGSPRATTFERESQLEASLRHLAGETGGKALLDAARTDLLTWSTADLGSYYWLGFTPARSHDDHRWKVEVEVKRPDLKVRARRSFTDLSTEREIGLAVESTLLFGNPASARPLVARLSSGVPVGRHRVRRSLSVEVPGDAVELLPEGDHFVARLELRVAALDDDGASAEARAIPVTLTSETREPSGALSYETVVELRQRTKRVVVALYDRANGSILLSSLDAAL
jgi:VWFA-related protein